MTGGRGVGTGVVAFFRQALRDKNVVRTELSKETSASFIHTEQATGKVMANYWYELEIQTESHHVSRSDLSACESQLTEYLEMQFSRDLDQLKQKVQVSHPGSLFSFNVVVSLVFNGEPIGSFSSHPALVSFPTGEAGDKEQKVELGDIRSPMMRKNALVLFYEKHIDSKDCFSDWKDAESRCHQALAEGYIKKFGTAPDRLSSLAQA